MGRNGERKCGRRVIKRKLFAILELSLEAREERKLVHCFCKGNICFENV